MTLTLELTAEEEVRLRAKASKAGLDEASYLKKIINGRNKTAKTPAELVAYWEANSLLTGYGDPAKDSVELARELREKFSKRENAT